MSNILNVVIQCSCICIVLDSMLCICGLYMALPFMILETALCMGIAHQWHSYWCMDLKYGTKEDAKASSLSPLKVQAPEIQDSLGLCALCLNLGLLWAYFSYGNRVWWPIDKDSYFDHLCILLHQCKFCHDFMYLLDLLICLLRGNVEIPSRNFPRPSLLWHKNYPIWDQQGLCMSCVRIILLMCSYMTKYPLEGVLSVMVF